MGAPDPPLAIEVIIIIGEITGGSSLGTLALITQCLLFARLLHRVSVLKPIFGDGYEPWYLPPALAFQAPEQGLEQRWW